MSIAIVRKTRIQLSSLDELVRRLIHNKERFIYRPRSRMKHSPRTATKIEIYKNTKTFSIRYISDISHGVILPMKINEIEITHNGFILMADDVYHALTHNYDWFNPPKGGVD